MQHGVCQGTATARTSLNTRAVVSDVPNVICLQPRVGKKRGEKAPRWADQFFNIDGQTCIPRASYPDNR